MSSKIAIIWCVMVLMAVSATAETYNVGGELNWAMPPLAGDAYRIWPQTINFQYGDVLVFNWTGTHNVVEVSRQDYDDCTFNNRFGAIQLSSPANFTITSGTSYYLCTVDRHCNAGMRLAVTVNSTDTSSATVTTFSVMFTFALFMLSLII